MESLPKLVEQLAIKRSEKSNEESFKKYGVSYFEHEIFEKLKGVQYNGCPANVLIGSRKISESSGYDMSIALTFVFDNCTLVNGTLSKHVEKIGDKKIVHSWVEKDGFVYDTKLGKKFEKKLYYKSMGVEINKSQTTEMLMQDEMYVKRKQTKLNDNLWLMDITIPAYMYILKQELEEYKHQQNEYYILLTISLIQYCKDILELPEVKKLIKKRGRFPIDNVVMV